MKGPESCQLIAMRAHALANLLKLLQYFRSCAISSVSWYFFMSSCMLSLRHHIPEIPSLRDFAQMCCALASTSGQTTSVFCFPGQCQHDLRVPPS